MGQTLSEPSQDKRTTVGENDRYAFAVSEMQGWRISMEDAHTTLLDLDDTQNNAFFAVYDGHGGGSVAKYAGQHVHQRLTAEEAYAEKDYHTAFKRAFLGTDDDLRADPSYLHDPSGCTAVAALLTSDGKIICANAGDSRAVLSVMGEAKPLSFDHKPQNQGENMRIVSAGGYVEFNRVNGNLALSRALGDFEFKQNFSSPPEEQVVTANPEITVHEVTEDDEFLVLACDGIWDCMSSQGTINWIRHQIAERRLLEQICEDTMSRCLSPDSDTAGGIGCDNMTILIVALLHGRTKEQWYDWVADNVERRIGYDTPRQYKPLYARSGYGFGGTEDSGVSNLLRPEPWLNLNRLSNPLYSRSAGISSMTLSEDDEFDDDDEFEDESGDETLTDGAADSWMARNLLGDPVRLRAPPARDETSSLRAQLEELTQEDARDDALMHNSVHISVDSDLEIGFRHSINSRGPIAIGSPLIPSPLALQDLRSPISLTSRPGGPESRWNPLSASQEKSDEAPPPKIPSPSNGVLEHEYTPSDRTKTEGPIDPSGAPTKK